MEQNSKIKKCICIKIKGQSRFVIKCGYNKQLIQIFKTINSRTYDLQTKLWSFDIKEHDELIRKCDAIKDIVVEPLSSIEKYSQNVHHIAEHFPKVVFKLRDPQHFDIQCTYNEKVINIFKTMSSKSYDINSKKWIFCLSEYDKLVEKLLLMGFENLDLLPYHVIMALTPKGTPQKDKNVCWDGFEDDDVVFDALANSQNETEIFQNIDSALISKLFPFQKEGVKLGICKFQGFVLLADDMGLGKTIQALAIAHYYKKDWPLLIVCPSSVRFHWAEAISNWLPSISTQNVTVIAPNSHSSWESSAYSESFVAKQPNKLSNNETITITSYDWLAKYVKKDLNASAKSLPNRHTALIHSIRSIILDESHYIKNYKSIRTKSVNIVAKNCKRIILCSGTPALSRPIELYTQIRLINPTIFPSLHEYGLRYCDGKHKTFCWDYNGSSNMNELQIILEERIMIRRMKSDVLKDLPQKNRLMVLLDEKYIQKEIKSLVKAAESMQNKKLKGLEKRGALLHYFRESASSKTLAVVTYIEHLLKPKLSTENDQKFIVFAHHQVMLHAIQTHLEKLDIQYILIDGQTSSEKRKQACDTFQRKSNYKVALLSITAANAGINLTAASTVVFAELFWNPGILVQAEDRAYRIGQNTDVTIQYLVAKSTADDFIWPLVQSKLQVLKGAGLTNEDFSKATTKNTAAQGRVSQNKMEDFWMKLLEDEEFVEELEDDLFKQI